MKEENRNPLHDFEKSITTYKEANIRTVFDNFVNTEKPAKYSKEVLRIGKKKWNLNYRDERFDDNRHVYPIKIKKGDMMLSTKKSFRKLVLGRTGSGKTYLIRGISDRFCKSGGYVIHLTDVKGEFFTSQKPSKYEYNLRKGEYPEGFPLKEYCPAYLYSVRKRNIIPMQIPLRNVSIEDLKTCLGDMGLSEAQVTLLQKCLHIEQKKIDCCVDGLISEISKSGFYPEVIRALKTKIENLKEYRVIGERYNMIDFEKDLEEYKIITLNLSGWDSMKAITQFYVGYLVRELIRLKRNRKISVSKRILVILDELGDFCPKDKDIVSRKEIEGLHRKGRALNISVLSGVQELRLISDEVIEQMDGCFIPSVQYINKEELKKIYKTNIRPDIQPSYIAYAISRISNPRFTKTNKDGTRNWYFADFERMWFYVFTPYATLSRHFEEVGT